MTDIPLISLAIVSHGDAEKVNHLLSSIQKHEVNTSRFQVILVDNLGNDLPDFNAAAWSSLQVLRNNRQRGLAYNNNRAFDAANGEFFAILNPDLTFESAVLDQLIASLKKYQAHLIAPQIIDTNNLVQDSFRKLPSPTEIIRRRLTDYQFKIPPPDTNGLLYPSWIAGMFWLMPSSTYRTLNGMDEKFKLYFEDVDFCTRAQQHGMKIIVDTHLQVIHNAQRASRRNIYYLFQHTKSAVQFFMSSVYRQARKKQID